MSDQRCKHGVRYPHECKDCIWEEPAPRYVPPPVYGPTTPNQEQMEREMDELVKQIQSAMNKRQVAETVTTVDPWGLLREALLSWNRQVNMSTFHDNVLDDWKACIADWRRINAALKQHDEEKKSDADL